MTTMLAALQRKSSPSGGWAWVLTHLRRDACPYERRKRTCGDYFLWGAGEYMLILTWRGTRGHTGSFERLIYGWKSV